MSWMKPWEMWDAIDADLEDWAKSIPRKKRKKAPNYFNQKGNRYMLEYSKSSRADCRVCRNKIQKNELRVGKEVQMTFSGGEFDDNVAQRMGPIWFHSSCYWSPSYRAHQHDPKRNSLQNYSGFELISVKDQEMVHLKVTGQAMSEEMVEDAVIAEATRQEEINKNGVFVDSDPFVIAESLVEKWLFNIPKADEVKQLVKLSGLTVEKGKSKKQDMLKLLHKQKFEKIPAVLTRALTKYLTAADLKEILGPLELKTSGNKGAQVSRLVCYLIEHKTSQDSNPGPAADIEPPTETLASNNNQAAAAGNTSPLQTRSPEEVLLMEYVKLYCYKYLRVQDLKGLLDEINVDRKGINKKAELMERVASLDLSLVQQLCVDALVECASPEDLRMLCEKIGVVEDSTKESTVQLLLAKMQAL